MKKTISLGVVFMMVGCQTVSRQRAADPVELRQQAQDAMHQGEYFKARKLTEQVLRQSPQEEEASKLMASILEREIAQQKEAFEERPFEKSQAESEEEIKTLLERSREMFRAKQYEEAMVTAEKVFAYDAENRQASELVDEIRKQVFAEGKQNEVFLKGMYRDEARERIVRYRKKAGQLMDSGQWGAAKLTVEKILLLAPGDKDATRQYEQIKQREALNS